MKQRGCIFLSVFKILSMVSEFWTPIPLWHTTRTRLFNMNKPKQLLIILCSPPRLHNRRLRPHSNIITRKNNSDHFRCGRAVRHPALDWNTLPWKSERPTGCLEQLPTPGCRHTHENGRKDSRKSEFKSCGSGQPHEQANGRGPHRDSRHTRRPK
jgi:hypothetical protein